MSTTQNSISQENQTNNRCSRRKRGLEPESIDTLHNSSASKKQKTYKMSKNELDELKIFFTDIKTDIENKIQDSQSSIETKLNSFTSQINTDVHELKVAIDDLKSKCTTEIDSLKNHMANHKQRLDDSDDDINRLKLSADLRVNGFAFNKEENLSNLFLKMAALIDYDCSNVANIPFIRRIPIRDKTTSIMIESNTITFHFMSSQQKQHFYSLYRNKMPLKPEAFGLSKDVKIIVGENLTRLNASIFKYAQQKKKENKIAQTFTTDGLVKVKFVKGPNQRAYTIRHSAQLDVLINDYTKHSQQQQLQHQRQGSLQHQHTHTMDFEQVNETGTPNTLNTSIELFSLNRDSENSNIDLATLAERHIQYQKQQHQNYIAATAPHAHSQSNVYLANLPIDQVNN